MEPLIGGDLLRRYLDLAIGAPRLHETNDNHPQQSQSGTPPDAPDEGESQQYRKEGEKEAGRIIPGDVHRFIGPLHAPILRSSALLLHGPERVRAVRLR